jgi:hypothetical protein
MLDLLRSLGFRQAATPEGDVVRVEMGLTGEQPQR